MAMQIKDPDKLIEMWTTDSQIDEYNLTEANLKTGKLHAKYAGILMTHSLIAESIFAKYTQLRQVKRLYYQGEMNTKEDLAPYGWEPLQKRILKGDVHLYLESDAELINLLLKKRFHDEIVEFCKYVLKELNSRTYQIRNEIEWKKYQAGG